MVLFSVVCLHFKQRTGSSSSMPRGGRLSEMLLGLINTPLLGRRGVEVGGVGMASFAIFAEDIKTNTQTNRTQEDQACRQLSLKSPLNQKFLGTDLVC